MLRIRGDYLLVVRELSLDEAHYQRHRVLPSQATISFEADLYLIGVFLVDEALEFCETFARDNDTTHQSSCIATNDSIHER